MSLTSTMPNRKDEMLAHFKAGLSRQKIALEMGIGSQTVKKWFHRFGIRGRAPIVLPFVHGPRTSGVYRLNNTATGEFYVGASKNLRIRWTAHYYKINGHRNSGRINDSFRGHGVSAIAFEVVELCSKKSLDRRERYWIKQLKPTLNTFPATYGDSRIQPTVQLALFCSDLSAV